MVHSFCNNICIFLYTCDKVSLEMLIIIIVLLFSSAIPVFMLAQVGVFYPYHSYKETGTPPRTPNQFVRPGTRVVSDPDRHNSRPVRQFRRPTQTPTTKSFKRRKKKMKNNRESDENTHSSGLFVWCDCTQRRRRKGVKKKRNGVPCVYICMYMYTISHHTCVWAFILQAQYNLINCYCCKYIKLKN